MRSTSFISLVAALMVWCSQALAQTNPHADLKLNSYTYFKGLSHEKITELCDSGSGLGTRDIFFCQKHIFEAAQEELQFQYKQALALQSKHDKNLFVKATPALMESQKYWLLYRNKACDYLYFSSGGGDPSRGGGSGVPSEYITCMTDMTNQRIKELTETGSQ